MIPAPRLLAAVLSMAVVGSAPSVLAAEGDGHAGTFPDRLPEQTADFWRGVKNPTYRRSRVLLRHGVERLSHAIRALIRDPHMPQVGRAHVQNGIVRLHLAHARAPRDPEALYLLAMARVLWRDDADPSRLTADDQETLALLHKLRRLDPEYQAARVAFELGILHTRAHEFERAAAEYERCLARLLIPTEADPTFRTPEDVLADRLFGAVPAPTVHYNLGDVTMALGDLPRAVEHYERAIDLGRRSGREFRTVLLSHWGLAAALDRFGEHAAALEHAREAVRLDDEPMAVLHLSSVFFEPAHEIHYYEALGHTVLADLAEEERGDHAERDPESELRAALRSWQRFLSEGGDASPWADLARRHLNEIRARLE
ncbi:MAG: tetratricopeptide repeat protein [Myxococcota bacterium]